VENLSTRTHLLISKDCPPFLELANLILFKHLGQDFLNVFLGE
jgi:hypothetical protein